MVFILETVRGLSLRVLFDRYTLIWTSSPLQHHRSRNFNYQLSNNSVISLLRGMTEEFKHTSIYIRGTRSLISISESSMYSFYLLPICNPCVTLVHVIPKIFMRLRFVHSSRDLYVAKGKPASELSLPFCFFDNATVSPDPSKFYTNAVFAFPQFFFRFLPKSEEAHICYRYSSSSIIKSSLSSRWYYIAWRLFY